MILDAARNHLAWAADVPLAEALALYPELAPHVGYVKVGLSLFVEHGPAAVEAFRKLGARVFLDLKLHDIPNTVELAAARAAALGVSFLTVHVSGGGAMMRAALAGAREGAQRHGGEAPRLLGVTVLTSLAEDDVRSLGFAASPADVVTRLAELACDSGMTGLVCSPREAAHLRSTHPELFLCTPGVRPPGAAAGDQARAETPAWAVAAGASLLVVGRPLHAAPSPGLAAEALAREISEALTRRAGAAGGVQP